MSDPRPVAVARRLSGVRRILAFCSAKGGVGKTFCSVTSSLALAGSGRRAGLLDLDFQGASTHLFLGAALSLPREKEGILPLQVAPNLSLLSAALFTGERALALRGPEVSDAMLELLCVTQWGELDALVVDMPPGIGDEILDIIRLIPRLEALVVSTPSIVSVAVAQRLLALLKESGTRISGVVANMCRGDAGRVREMARQYGIRILGEVPFNEGVEGAVGDPSALLAGSAGSAIKAILAGLGML